MSGGDDDLARLDDESNMAESAYPFFLHNVYAGLVPPFSQFFYDILSHYGFQALHLQLSFILLVAIFSFYREGFMGVKPSVALLHHFFSVRFTSPDHSSACVSFVDVKGETIRL
ncbi:retrotransposon unclassified [Hordeum vulgare]|nr:retrotransposon unclassified [Hordeum vulgare]